MHEDKGRIPKERYHFPLMSKGEREKQLMRIDGHMVEYDECFHQCQRGILLDSWLSLMSTLGEIEIALEL
jgi:hypothetical protein